MVQYNMINSLAPGGFENIFQNVFFKLISWIDTLSNSCETALRSMPQNPSDDKSTLVQVMAWCRQAASHYLSQCCPRSLSPYGVTRPQWVKGRPRRTTNHEGVVAVTPDRPWSIPIITWLNNVILHVLTTKYVQNQHQIERRRLLASIVTSRIFP